MSVEYYVKRKTSRSIWRTVKTFAKVQDARDEAAIQQEAERGINGVTFAVFYSPDAVKVFSRRLQ